LGTAVAAETQFETATLVSFPSRTRPRLPGAILREAPRSSAAHLEAVWDAAAATRRLRAGARCCRARMTPNGAPARALSPGLRARARAGRLPRGGSGASRREMSREGHCLQGRVHLKTYFFTAIPSVPLCCACAQSGPGGRKMPRCTERWALSGQPIAFSP